MTDKDKQPKSILSGNVLREMGDYFRLVIRLMGDARVSPWLKLLPVGALVYLLNPFDIPTPIDDIGVIGMGLYLFVEMCPADVVEEHRMALNGVVIGTARDIDDSKNHSDDVEILDADFRVEE